MYGAFARAMAYGGKAMLFAGAESCGDLQRAESYGEQLLEDTATQPSSTERMH